MLCEQNGVRPAKLGTAAGFSHELVPNWIAEARAGTALPGTYDRRLQIAEHYGVSIEWLQGREPLLPGTKPPTKSAAPAPVGTLELAEEAADMLQRLDHIPPARAWGLMRGIRVEKPSVLAFYEEARKRLEKGKP